MDTLVLRSRDSTTMEHWVQCTREACDKLHADLHASAVARKKTEDFLREPWVTARFQSLGVITDEGRRKAVYNDTLNDVKTAGRHDAVWKTVIRTPLDDEATAVMVQNRALHSAFKGFHESLEKGERMLQDFLMALKDAAEELSETRSKEAVEFVAQCLGEHSAVLGSRLAPTTSSYTMYIIFNIIWYIIIYHYRNLLNIYSSS